MLAWASAITGREGVLEDEGGPQPAKPYFSLSVRSSKAMERGRVEVDRQTETINALHRVTFRLAVRGGPAMADAARLRDSLISAHRWRDLWRVAGLGAVTEIQNLSAVENSRQRGRAEFQLTLHAVIQTTAAPEYFTTQHIDLYETDQGFVARVTASTPSGDC